MISQNKTTRLCCFYSQDIAEEHEKKKKQNVKAGKRTPARLAQAFALHETPAVRQKHTLPLALASSLSVHSITWLANTHS